METLSTLLAICEENPPVTVDSRPKGLVIRIFDILEYVRIV